MKLRDGCRAWFACIPSGWVGRARFASGAGHEAGTTIGTPLNYLNVPRRNRDDAVVRLSSRAPSRSSSAWTWLLTVVVDMLRRRPAAENPPSSTTRTNAVRLVSRSIGASDYPPSLDNASSFFRIITRRAILHLRGVPAPSWGGRKRTPRGHHVDRFLCL